MSPYLTKCCLRASATVSYQNAERDLHFYTGIKVSSKTHQRLVHRYKFPEEICNEKLEEISVDGGKVRLRNPTQGESCIWKDSKAICANQTLKKAWFGENKKKAKALLWQGKVDETLALISPLTRKQAQNFCRYLETHRLFPQNRVKCVLGHILPSDGDGYSS